ncbi:MAG: hypothetical protein V3T05_05660 [Myxococcota bacterium]
MLVIGYDRPPLERPAEPETPPPAEEAAAQPDPKQREVEEILVTGSRIIRAPSPSRCAEGSSRWWVLAASLVSFAVCMIPPSAMASELDPATGEINTGAAPHAILADERAG